MSFRWAAKEAIIKASTKRLYMKDIIIISSSNGPYGIIPDESETEQSSKVSIEDINGQIVHLSISHEDDYAVATAIVPFRSSTLSKEDLTIS